MSKRHKLTSAHRWVIKIGSALLTDNGVGLNRDNIAKWVQQIAHLRQQGMEILLVSSGAVAEGMCRLGWQRRPHALHAQQAAAAVGQMGLVQAWESSFSQYGLQTADPVDP
jgi:glutamate 5-kinase